jgi:hypothetical protein
MMQETTRRGRPRQAIVAAAALAVWAAAGAAAGQPQNPGDPGGIGLRMDRCLIDPSPATAQALAAAIHAAPETADTSPPSPRLRPDPEHAGQTLRTRVTVTGARRWRVNHVEIRYQEETYQRDAIETRSGRVLRTMPPERTRACLVTFTQDDAAADFDGVRISLDGPAYGLVLDGGRTLAFVRPPRRPGEDMNVVFGFERPLRLTLPPSPGATAWRLRVDDAADTVLPPTARLPEAVSTRAALVAAMRGPARMTISNTVTQTGR